MLIITGPGRSGTSVLALFCQKLGYDPGGQWNASVDAGLEHPQVVAINDALLGDIWATGTTKKTLAAHADTMRQLPFPVIKDPRFTFHPGILRAWRSVRDDLTVILTYRKPEHSLASRQRKAELLQHPGKTHPDTLRKDFADTIECLLELGIPFRVFLFPHFLEQYRCVQAALTELGLAIPEERGERAWRAIVNRKKVHFGSLAPPSDSGQPGSWRLDLHHLATRLWKGQE
ncbi:MAG TPA: hypothetical protein VFB21_09010 [Chthonomonadaceae bacterium]|nr:hypothetical protein [Chthonomonadaceae bacterium]